MSTGGRQQTRTHVALAVTSGFAATHPLLCLSLPHRWFPFSKTLSVCVRCRGVCETHTAPRFTPKAATWLVTR